MVFSAFRIRFVQLLLVAFGVAFILFNLRESIHGADAPTQQVWSNYHDWDNFDAIGNETLGVIIPLRAAPNDTSAHDYLVSKSLRHQPCQPA